MKFNVIKFNILGNNIKSIEHLNHNMHLEHLDLSNNQISFIADISYLKNLKVILSTRFIANTNSETYSGPKFLLFISFFFVNAEVCRPGD